MAKQSTQETLGFNNYSGYYGSIAQGYGGLNWGDIDYMNATYWEQEKTNWCDTGFQNVIKGTGEAFTWSNNGSTSYAVFTSANLKETFDLKSMVAASAWETDQPFDFRSYTYTKNKGFILKASDTIYVSQTRHLIDFAKVGNPGDFQNIVAVEIVSGSGKYGNTCSYGRYGYTLGNEMAFDNMKVQWNGKIPKSHGKVVMPNGPFHDHGRATHITAAHLVSNDAHNGTGPAAHPLAGTGAGAPTGFHSELLSIGSAHWGDLTSQFQLPATEHFGS